MNDQNDGYGSLSDILRAGDSFALWRMPDEKWVHGIGAEKALVYNATDLPEVHSQSGYLIAPFDVSKFPFVWIPSQRRWKGVFDSSVADRDEFQFGKTMVESGRLKETSKEDYFLQTRYLIDQIRQQKAGKVIISRVIEESVEAHAWGRVFSILCDHYPQAYVFAYFTPQTGLWLGATPELFFQSDGDRALTVSLAGTRSNLANNDPQVWDVKEVNEQEIVTQFMLDVLKRFNAEDLQKSDPHTVQAGPVSHIKTTFRFRHDQDSGAVMKLMLELHPTPALCGYPKAEAQALIDHVEKHSRLYYGGFIGEVSHGIMNCYVNIRCMTLFEGKAFLFVGGGLTSFSNPEKEWNETVLKAQTLLSVLKNI